MEYHVADKKNDVEKSSRSIIKWEKQNPEMHVTFLHVIYFFFKKEDKNMH